MSDATDTTKHSTGEPGFNVLGIFRRPEVGAFAGLIIVFLFFTWFGWDRNFLSPLAAAAWLNFASTVGIIAIPIGFSDDRRRARHLGRSHGSRLENHPGHLPRAITASISGSAS